MLWQLKKKIYVQYKDTNTYVRGSKCFVGMELSNSTE